MIYLRRFLKEKKINLQLKNQNPFIKENKGFETEVVKSNEEWN